MRPPVQMGSAFSDGTALTIHTDLDRTCASISRFSQKDADTFHRLYEETKGYMDLILLTLMYSPPISMNDITKALVAWGVEDKAEFLSVHLRRLNINQFLDQHFENEKVKAHLAFHAALAGYSTDRRGLATSFPLLVGKIDNWHVCVGGSHALAHAIWEAFAQAGGRVFLKHGVERIVIENGKAVGVELEDGSVVRARQLVASSINLEQTFLKMLDPAALPDGFVDAVEGFPHMDWSFFSVHLAMSRAPEYAAAEFDPDINQAWVVNVGYDSPEDLSYTIYAMYDAVNLYIAVDVSDDIVISDSPPEYSWWDDDAGIYIDGDEVGNDLQWGRRYAGKEGFNLGMDVGGDAGSIDAPGIEWEGAPGLRPGPRGSCYLLRG